MKNRSNSLLLPIVLAIAISLRFVGLDHGFPFIFHPDEPTTVRTALAIRFFPNPGHFDWPHLYMYLNYFLYMGFAVVRNVIAAIGYKEAVSTAFPYVWNDEVIYYFLTRVFSAFLGALTVLPIYLAARDSFGKRVGIIAALTFAVVPYHVWQSHYALIDVPMLFFASWGVFYALFILRRVDVNDYAGAGFYIGLAASTKYNGGLTLITVPLAHLMRVIKNKEKLFNVTALYNLGLSVFTAAVGFLMGTPYALLDYDTFLINDNYRGALWQFRNVGSNEGFERIPAFYNDMVYKISDDLGYTILIGFGLLLGVLLYRLATKKSQPEDTALWFLVISGVFFLFYISGFSRSRSHYYFIAYPYIVVSFAYFLNLLLIKFGERNKLIGALIFFILLGPPAYLSLKNAFTFYRPDTRVQLYEWMQTNVTKSDFLIYNKTSLAPVIKKFENKRSQGEPSQKDTSSGFMFIGYDDSCNCSTYPIENYAQKVKKVQYFNNSGRTGSAIEIYTYNK